MKYSKNAILLKGASVYAEDRIYKKGGVIIDAGKIQEILSAEKIQAVTNVETIELGPGDSLVPGFIDLHIHGAAGKDTMDADGEALRVIAGVLPREGTTSFLPTTMTESAECIEKAMRSVKEYAVKQVPDYGAEVLGVNLEGPFISEKMTGAQNPKYVIPPMIELFSKWQDLSGNLVRIVTLAPEADGALEFIRDICRTGVIASMGHSNADFEQAGRAIRAGATQATHVFNAMRPFHHRDPGLTAAVLLSSNVMAEIIADGFHLDPNTVKFICKIKGIDKILLVTDAMRAKFLQEGKYDLGGQAVTVKDGQARIANGKLAGSILQMQDSVKNMISFTGCALADAVKMAAENPARVLKCFARKGSIKAGKDADLAVVNSEYRVVLTLCRGKIAFDAFRKNYEI